MNWRRGFAGCGAAVALSGCVPVGCPEIGYTAISTLGVPADLPPAAALELRLCQDECVVVRPRVVRPGGAEFGGGGTRSASFEQGPVEATLTVRAPEGTVLLTASGTIPVTVNEEGVSPCTQYTFQVRATAAADGSLR
ncbi:hypothetical protein [Amycolatopsis suaedae]|uniref:Uncharacterized protein n=1 Tax=Amycolatopsis suaedae TaxID=2510978 RepID=A0A4Q7JC75_9PSEU|nr:hypothetical protein [Amycolatopsis suaedae]RZQ63894.1 hypothetical protein EWH70_12150 [Amycolatopsis suaedae]